MLWLRWMSLATVNTETRSTARPVRVSRSKMQFTFWSQLALNRRGRTSAFPFPFSLSQLSFAVCDAAASNDNVRNLPTSLRYSQDANSNYSYYELKLTVMECNYNFFPNVIINVYFCPQSPAACHSISLQTSAQAFPLDNKKHEKFATPSSVRPLFLLSKHLSQVTGPPQIDTPLSSRNFSPSPFSGHEDDEEDEEEDEDAEDLDHEPPVGGHALEVLEELPVSGLNVHGGVLHVAVYPHLEIQIRI